MFGHTTSIGLLPDLNDHGSHEIWSFFAAQLGSWYWQAFWRGSFVLIRSRISWRQMVQQVWPLTLGVFAYSIFITGVDVQFHLEALELPVSFAALPGAFVGVILAFRTNSSYRRWWEARILWGQIVNDSRTWVRQLISYTGDADDVTQETVSRMAHRQIAWCYALASALRRQSQVDELDSLMDPNEVSSVMRHTNMPNAILLMQGRDLRGMRDRDVIDTWQFVAMEQTLGRLTDSMGGCERIRNTPFPPHYRTWIHFLIYFFIACLPFTLVGAHAVVITLITVPVAVGYLMIEQVALDLENPFTEAVTGTPMSAISRAIEINIRQMLSEPEIPGELEPVNDVLY